MENDKVLIVEEYRGGKLVKRTANGHELEVSDFERGTEVFYQQSIYLSKEEFENIYGPREL